MWAPAEERFPGWRRLQWADPSGASTWIRTRLRSHWAGLASFKPGLWLAGPWWRGRPSLVAITAAGAATTGREAQLHPERATYLSTWTPLNFDPRAWGYKRPTALFLLSVWSWWVSHEGCRKRTEDHIQRAEGWGPMGVYQTLLLTLTLTIHIKFCRICRLPFLHTYNCWTSN